MCGSCPTHATRMREQIEKFEAMAAADTDPLIARRLRRAVEDLRASAAPLASCNGCDADVVRADAPAVA